MQTASARATSPAVLERLGQLEQQLMRLLARRRRSPGGALEPLERLRHHVAIAVEPGDQPRGAESQLRRARRILERLDAAVDVARAAQRQAALVVLLRIVQPDRFADCVRMVAEDAVEIGRGACRARRLTRRGCLDVVERDAEIDLRRPRTRATGGGAAGIRGRRECCRDRSRSRSWRNDDSRATRRGDGFAGCYFLARFLGSRLREASSCSISASSARDRARSSRGGDSSESESPLRSVLMNGDSPLKPRRDQRVRIRLAEQHQRAPEPLDVRLVPRLARARDPRR